MTESSGLPYGIRPPGFRLPDDTSVGRVQLQIADLDRSIDYYQRVLGLHVHDRSRGHAALGPAGDRRILVELFEQPGARPVPRRGSLGLFHFAMLLPDRPALGRFLRHALAHGAISGMADHAVSEAAYLTDPDGLGIEVYRDRPRAEWRARVDRELHLTTEPLDVDGVINAGGDGAWAAAPAGTVMGHIHLHVGDLDRAERFYHRAIGFDKIVWTFPGALFMSAGGYHHHLGTNTWSRGAAAAEDEARLLSWDLEVSAPDEVAVSVERAGFTPEPIEGGGWRAADPWGTGVEIRSRAVR